MKAATGLRRAELAVRRAYARLVTIEARACEARGNVAFARLRLAAARRRAKVR